LEFQIIVVVVLDGWIVASAALLGFQIIVVVVLDDWTHILYLVGPFPVIVVGVVLIRWLGIHRPRVWVVSEVIAFLVVE
jgi:hypothetical protein